ncbi:tyrosine-type recombinase/integrase [Niveibacterium sp.]|uniref:tyrosine-type recombinase/integrase n=1 Tax=Niveibacterium sp. TaxID=2017444 RepID=UPI0035B3BF1C
MAEPYREGRGWAMRQRHRGQDFYVSGQASAAAARRAMAAAIALAHEGGSPDGHAARRTSLAQALQRYGLERLPTMKGARQEAGRINRYLRSVGLETLVVRPVAGDAAEPDAGQSEGASATLAHPARNRLRKAPVVHWVVTLAPPTATRPVPKGLAGTRSTLARLSENSDRLRAQLASRPVGDVHRADVQRLIDALCSDGLSAASVGLERALLRSFFNHAKRRWGLSLRENFATVLKLPTVSNGRERTLTDDEERRILAASETCHSARVRPAIELLLATAMRCSELLALRWGRVELAAHRVRLRDSKSGPRFVPLLPEAEAVLARLQATCPCGPEERVIPMTYEALKAAWQRICERAGVEGVNLHDLRHTAATRVGRLTGSVLAVMALTGHKTVSQAMRYTHVAAEDCRDAVLRARASLGQTPVPDASPPPASVSPEGNALRASLSTKVVQVDFRRARRA